MFSLVCTITHSSGSTSSTQSHTPQVQPPLHHHTLIRFNLIYTITCESGSIFSAQSHAHQVQHPLQHNTLVRFNLLCTIIRASVSTSVYFIPQVSTICFTVDTSTLSYNSFSTQKQPSKHGTMNIFSPTKVWFLSFA